MTSCFEIMGCRKLGLLDLLIEIEFEDKIEPKITQSIANLTKHLEKNKFNLTKSWISGSYSSGKTTMYKLIGKEDKLDKQKTEIHELAHQEADEIVGETIGQEFDPYNDGQAYTYEDFYYYDIQVMARRKNLSFRINEIHEIIKNDPALIRDTNTQIKMNKIICDSNIIEDGFNWAAFLNVVANFQYYTIFYEVYQEFGLIEGREQIKESMMEIKRKGSMYDGLFYLYNLFSYNEAPFYNPLIQTRENKLFLCSNEVVNEVIDKSRIVITTSNEKIKRAVKELEIKEYLAA